MRILITSYVTLKMCTIFCCCCWKNNFSLLFIFREVIKNFNGTAFIANGPQMMTRIFNDICSTENRTLWTQNQCNGFNIFPKEKFYPISWTDYIFYFQPEKRDEVLKLIENSTIIHVWNDRSKHIWNKKNGPKNAYQVTAERNCPFVYSESVLF